jgi:hypothetical protein
MAQILGAIFLALITWMAFKSLRAFGDAQVRGKRDGGASAPKQGSQEPLESMVECAVCKTFRPASRSTACEREGCPYGN